MDGKTLFLFVILPAGVVALLVWLSLDTWRDIEKIKSSSPSAAPTDDEPADAAKEPTLRQEKKGKPRSTGSQSKSAAPAPADPSDIKRLIEEGEASEQAAAWPAAYAAYEKAMKLQGTDDLKPRVEAMKLVITAGHLEESSKKAAAVHAYKRAVGNVRNVLEIERRIERLSGGSMSARGGRSAPALPKLDSRTSGSPDERMLDLLAVLGRKKLAYAQVCACGFYLQVPELAGERTVLNARRDVLLEQIGGDRDKYPCLSVQRGFTRVELMLKNGKRIAGELAESTDQWIKVRQMRGGRIVSRLIVRKEIVKEKQFQKTRKEINNTRAADCLRSALILYETGRSFDCLTALGQLVHEFRDSTVLTDKSLQKTMIGGMLKTRGKPGDASLQLFISLAVQAAEAEAQRLGRVCSDCDGKGVLPCKRCGNTGVVTEMCGICRKGTVACSECNGTGSVRCGACGGSGVSVNAGNEPTDCPKCKNGLVKCRKCRKGRVACPDCGGSQQLSFTCPACLGEKKVRCKRCNGSGQLAEGKP